MREGFKRRIRGAGKRWWGGYLQLINAGREAPDCTDAGRISPQKILFFKYAPVANILLLCWPSFSVSVEKILRFWFKLCWKAALLPMMYGAGGRLTAAQLHSLPLQRNDRLSRELHKNCTSPPLSNPMQVGFTALRHSTSSTQVHSAVPSLLLYFLRSFTLPVIFHFYNVLQSPLQCVTMHCVFD